MELIDAPMRLKYLHPYKDNEIVDAGPTLFDKGWYGDWLDGMVTSNSEVIFFLVVESTDVFEKEWDFNEVAIPTLPEDLQPDRETRIIRKAEILYLSLDKEPNAFGYGVQYGKLIMPDGEEVDLELFKPE